MSRTMKNSGVAWLGDIPADWTIRPLKGVAKRVIVGLATSVTQYYRDKGTPIFRNLNIKDDELTDDDLLYLDEEWASLQTGKMIKSGDILTVHTGYVGISCIVPERYGGALTFTTLITTPRKDTINTRFLMRYINVSRFYSPIYFNVETGAQNNLNTKAFVNLEIAVPPLEEQQRIAAFLDDKCARIDSVVTKTRATVEEYRKLKQAIITRAVTKGIRPNRTLKPSGIEWLGDIPADWEVVQVKRFASVNNGREVPEEIDQTAEAVPVYGSGGVFKYTTDYLYEGETVMFGRKGTLGKPIYANERFWTVDTMYYLTFSDKLFAKFNYYQLCAFDWEPHITQTALPSIVASEIVSCKFAFPPLEEQREIAAYLDEKCAAIDSLVAKKNRLVEELERLKKSLIFEYVTGKKEVAR